MRCVTAPPHKQVGKDVHIDDVHGFGPDPHVENFKEDFAAHIWLRDSGVHREGAKHDLDTFPQEIQWSDDH